MKIKKMFAGVLSITMLSMVTLTVFAETPKDALISTEIGKSEEIMLISEKKEIGHEFEFGSFTGTVVEINDFTPIEGGKIISLEDAEKAPIKMIVSKDTYVVNDDEITVGATVTGYFDANAPMILIYPPQYNPEVVVVENNDYQVKVDIFNKELVSVDNMLQLNILEDTKITTQDGKAFKGELANEKLVIIYDVSTKSIPAQTTPREVIVLDQEKEVVMVPLRAIAEALELEVVWEGKLESIRVGIGATLKIDHDEYTFAKMAPIKLGTAPALIDGTTFVPLDFFTKVLQIDKADVLEAQMLIK